MLLPRQPAGRVPASENVILEDSKRHSRRLGKLAIDASNVSWKHDEAERAARLASGAARLDAFASLAALNASYAAASVTRPAPARAARFRKAMGSIGRAAAHAIAVGVTVGLVLSGIAHATAPRHPLPIVQPAIGCFDMPVLAWAVAAVLAARAAELDVLRRKLDRPARALLIHPIWRP